MIPLLPETCELTRLQRENAKDKWRVNRDSWRYGTNYNTRRPDSYQVMTISSHTITINATLPNLYKLIAEADKAQTEKPRKPKLTPNNIIIQPPLFITQERVGSHHEFVKWNHETNEYDYSTKPKRGYSHRVENDYTTHFHDCLCGKEWLEAHYKDIIPEPTIEISIDGKSLSLNGNYKKGMIQNFLEGYTTKAKRSYTELSTGKTKVKTIKIDIAEAERRSQIA